jgi:hypothetical protein
MRWRASLGLNKKSSLFVSATSVCVVDGVDRELARRFGTALGTKRRRMARGVL